MAYTFRIHKGTDAQHDGWQRSEELTKGNDNRTGINSIDDSIEGGNAGKIGTSIPTPFARIYLFETAFAFISSNRGNNSQQNFYDQLVSQALDLLQLVFEKGKDNKLKLYEWNGEMQVSLLNSSAIKEGHKALANSLNMSIMGNPNLKRIILIEYDGILLGGTSPMTLTYTSPNAIRILEEKGIQLYTNDKGHLFKRGSIVHLNQRSVDFQKYVYWLVKNNTVFQEDNTPLIYFYNYVQSFNLNFSEDDLRSVGQYYPELTRQSEGRVDVRLSVYKDLSLRYNDTPIVMEDSDFLMRPSVRCFGNGPIPIVLPTDGDAAYEGWRYTTNETWNLMTRVEYFMIENESLDNRLLPTNGANNSFTTNKYPWLTTDDFFEKSIVCLGFDLNKSHFYFPTVQDHGAQFLLPIKKEYFKYFTLDDLRESLSCEVMMGNNNIPKEVTFRLKLKLRNRPFITLGRRYVASMREDAEYRIVDSRGMSFGVFPFYRCMGENDLRNEYSIYLYGFSGDTQYANLHFYKQNLAETKLSSVVDSDTGGAGTGLVRTTTGDTGYSKVYNLRNETSNSFDIIEVELREGNRCCGLAIPLWTEPSPIDNNRKAIISVDFGTSNTYVSYLEDGTAKPLTIGESDQQMVLLNDKSFEHGTSKSQYRKGDDFGSAQYMAQYLREFVPSIIGNASAVSKDEYIAYPIKTATIEKQNFQPTDKLFSGISIGFNIDNEKTAVETARFNYVTNLKWNAEEHNENQAVGNNAAEFNKDINRIKAFCDQTLWMIKNKLVMKGYATSGEIMYFYPDSMSKTGRKIFKDAWNRSVEDIFTKRGFKMEVKEELEAISPYYSLLVLHGERIYGRSTANIDIGGGTTDYFILDQSRMTLSAGGAESGKAYEASIFFAGNDLWGATYPESINNARYQKNGFVSYMVDMVQFCEQREEAEKLFQNYDRNKGMADFSGFFFKNDDIFGFSDRVASHRKFRFVVFLHYAAIIYHFAEMLKMIKLKDPEFKYPEVLTFTGKGSEYVNMISEESDHISQITTDLIKAFGIEDFNRIDIIRVDNPKALTADGGIYEMMSNSALRINLFDEDAFGARMSSTLTNTPYKRIGNDCLGLPARNDGSTYKKADVMNVADIAIKEFEKFADAVFHSQQLAKTRSYLQFDINDEDYNLVMQYAKSSYNIHAHRYLDNNIASASEDLCESVFFFALKNTLINLSIHYYENVIKVQR